MMRRKSQNRKGNDRAPFSEHNHMGNQRLRLRPEMVNLELEALAQLLHHRARRSIEENRKRGWRDRVPNFRSVVRSGMGPTPRFPNELLADEIVIAARAVRWIVANFNKATRRV